MSFERAGRCREGDSRRVPLRGDDPLLQVTGQAADPVPAPLYETQGNSNAGARFVKQSAQVVKLDGVVAQLGSYLVCAILVTFTVREKMLENPTTGRSRLFRGP